MIKMKCKKCNHEWEYNGKSELYVTCPHCYRKIKVIDNSIINNQIIEKEVYKNE